MTDETICLQLCLWGACKGDWFSEAGCWKKTQTSWRTSKLEWPQVTFKYLYCWRVTWILPKPHLIWHFVLLQGAYKSSTICYSPEKGTWTELEGDVAEPLAGPACSTVVLPACVPYNKWWARSTDTNSECIWENNDGWRKYFIRTEFLLKQSYHDWPLIPCLCFRSKQKEKKKQVSSHLR